MKKPLKLRYIGDPVLVTKAKEIPEITDEIRELSAEMIQLMYRSNGVGLAGNQIGLAQKIVVIHVDAPEDKDGNPLPLETPGEQFLYPKMPITLINPEIVEYSEEQCGYEEGCLSVPKLYGNVIRSNFLTAAISCWNAGASLPVRFSTNWTILTALFLLKKQKRKTMKRSARLSKK